METVAVGWGVNRDFWRHKRVLVTGHTGFKGSWLALWLNHLGATVCGYALAPSTQPNMFTAARIEDCVEHHIGDIRDPLSFLLVLEKFAPDIVLHLAAQSIVRDSYLNPVETYAVNVIGTVNVLEAVRRIESVSATIIVTSDKCYENRETMWPYREYEAMGGFDPYSSSKGCAELVTSAYGRSFFQPSMKRGSVASVRAGNVIGGGDWATDRLMADLMRGLVSGEDIIIRSPRAVRPWQHVLEPLCGYLNVAQNLCENGPLACDSWNFGPGAASNQTVESLARLTCELWGRPNAMRIQEDINAPHEAGQLRLDSTKALTGLIWRPRWSFEECAARTVDWYRAFAEGADMRAFTVSQIEIYEKGAA